MADADNVDDQNIDDQNDADGSVNPDGGDGSGDNTGNEPFDKDRAQAKINKTNRENANLRARLKEAEKAASELDELKKSQLSKEERLASEVKSAQETASKLQDQLNRQIVRNELGLTEAQAKRLVGTSLEELTEDAKELLEAFPTKGAANKKANTPDPDSVSGGSKPRDNSEKPDPKKLASLVRRR